MITNACKMAYASCGLCSNSCRDSLGLVFTECFICRISSNICSGGRLATALVIASGAACGGTGSPYGEGSWLVMGGPTGGGLGRSFSSGELMAESNFKVRPFKTRPCKFRTALMAVSGSSYSPNPKPRGRPLTGSHTILTLVTGPISDNTAVSCSSVVSNEILAIKTERIARCRLGSIGSWFRGISASGRKLLLNIISSLNGGAGGKPPRCICKPSENDGKWVLELHANIENF